MKSLLFSLIVAATFSQAMAESLLSCTPPMGSGLQQIDITKVGNKIYRSELKFSGAFSTIQMKAAAWNKKDMTFKSPTDGVVHFYLMDTDQGSVWSYESNVAIGNCIVNPKH